MPSRSVPFGVKPRTWSATSSPRKPSMGSPASNPYAPTPRACWIPAANTGVLKTVSTTFATSPLMKIARASAVAQAPRSWPPFAISPYRFSASPELATSPQHFAAVLVRAIPSSFASSGCDFDVAVGLLLLRLATATALIHYGIAGLGEASQFAPTRLPMIAAGAGIFLLGGLWTPLAGVLVTSVEVWIVFSRSGDPWIPFILAALGATLAMVGP